MEFINYYKVLHVLENAPPEIIKASYESLAKKYHVDIYKQPDAEIKRRQIKEAYEVLIDSNTRKKYDDLLKYIRAQKAHNNKQSFGLKIKKISYIFIIFIGIIFILSIISEIFFPKKIEYPLSNKVVNSYNSTPLDPENKRTKAIPSSSKDIEQKKSCLSKFPKAPNNFNWPKDDGYLRKMPVKNLTGHSTLTIDNSQIESDVYIKLWDIQTVSTVRHFLVKAHSSYTIVDINPSTYTVRAKFLNINSACDTTESETFNLTESEDYYGNITYSQMSMTLYKVTNGNMDSKDISEDKFDKDI